jgi:hypothetical protein
LIGIAAFAGGAANYQFNVSGHSWWESDFAYAGDTAKAGADAAAAALIVAATAVEVAVALPAAAMYAGAKLNSPGMYRWGATQSGLLPAAETAQVKQGQALIDDIRQNEMRNVNFTVEPQFDPSVKSDGLSLQDRPTQPGFIKIGPSAVAGGRANTVITLAHEQTHHNIWAREAFKSEFYTENVALRFARAKGVISAEEYLMRLERARQVYGVK